MLKFSCSLCGAILFPEEAIRHIDRLHGDIYVSCPFCRSQCEKYIETEDTEATEEIGEDCDKKEYGSDCDFLKKA